MGVGVGLVLANCCLHERDRYRARCGAEIGDAGIDYMLTGSMAMNYYAVPRMTRDIDIIITVTVRDRCSRLCSPDYYVSEESVRESVAAESMLNLLQQSLIKVDCIVRKLDDQQDGIPAAPRSGNASFKVMLVSETVQTGKDSRSAVQLRDVKNLLATGFDAGSVTQWTTRLGLADLLQDATARQVTHRKRSIKLARTADVAVRPERSVMGAEMFDAARVMVKASLSKNLYPTERRSELFRRIYGQGTRKTR